MNNCLKFLFVLILGMCSFQVNATHIVGASMGYTCQSPGTFRIYLDLWVECGALPAPAFKIYTINSSCSPTWTDTLFLESEVEMGQLCGAQASNSVCRGGALPSVLWRRYERVITLPVACSDWEFSIEHCCRHNSNNLAGMEPMYTSTLLNSLKSPCNTSPEWTTQHVVKYVCLNQEAAVNFGTVFGDADSTAYSLVAGRSSDTTTIAYDTGYSGASPIPGITIHPQTGQLRFTPTLLGELLLVVQADEYSRDDGSLLGTTQYDAIINVISCTNQTPTAESTGVSNVTGGATKLSPWEISAQRDSSFCFDVVFEDPDAGDNLFVLSNVGGAFLNSTFNWTGSNPATLEVCVSMLSSDTLPQVISVLAKDDNCPFSAITEEKILVQVTDKVSNPNSIESPDQELGVRAYPNPTQSTLFLELQHLQTVSAIEIHSSTGLLEETKIVAQSMEVVQLDLSGLATGMYFAVIHTAQGSMSVPVMLVNQ